MAKHKYIYGDVPDSIFLKSGEDFLKAASEAGPVVLGLLFELVIVATANTKQEAVNTFDTITKALNRGKSTRA